LGRRKGAFCETNRSGRARRPRDEGDETRVSGENCGYPARAKIFHSSSWIKKKGKPMPNAKKKPVPEFRTEDDERKFWAEHDSTEFIDWQSAQRHKFPHLKPTLRTISVRLPVSMIEDLKLLANKRDVPYQSLLKVFLAERLEKERRRA
jgi:predicted DNA binding CopG/RHH family protein